MNKCRSGLLVAVWFAGQALAEPAIPELITSYQTDPALCAKIRSLETAFKGCDEAHESCFVPKAAAESVSVVPAKELAVNQYGYTQVFVSYLPGKPYAVVFLNGFNGDRHPRLIETWKVDAAQLDRVVNLDPHPLAYEAWVKGGHGIDRQTLATEFADLLSDGEKLSDDWSPVWTPVLQVNDSDYFFTRECAGTWSFGGIYRCSEVIKVIVKRIEAAANSVAVCEFAKRKSDQGKSNNALERTLEDSRR